MKVVPKIPKTKIAQILGIARSTLYAELRRGSVEQLDTNLVKYQKHFADAGQRVYEEHRKNSRNPCKLANVSEFIEYAEERILKHKPHRSRPLEKLCAIRKEDMPVWFKNGMLAAVLAPTAVNQQKFFIDIDGENAVITPGRSPLAKIDLGIVRYNFEAASGHKCVRK